TLSIGITLDCDSKAATVTVLSNDTGEPVHGAKTYMFYTDYGYNALPNPGITGFDGVTVMQVPGNIRYLTAIFVLRTDMEGFQSREVESTYKDCFAPPQPQPQPSPPPHSPPSNNSTAQNQTPPPPLPQPTPQNQTGQPNVSTPTPSPHPPAGGGTNSSGSGQK